MAKESSSKRMDGRGGGRGGGRKGGGTGKWCGKSHARRTFGGIRTSDDNDGESQRFRKRRKLEIKFDPEARRSYLTGFSARKKERRAFGLAMQKVKDRKAKIEERKEARAADLEHVMEMERQKRYRQGCGTEAEEDAESSDCDVDGDRGDSGGKKESISTKYECTSATSAAAATMTTFQDEATRSQFGGDVVVSISYGVPVDSDEEAEESALDRCGKPKSSSKSNLSGGDVEQRYAGNVKKYMAELKGNMPSKKNRHAQHGNKYKGKHGAANMKGMGGAENLKVAQKTLARYKKRGSGEDGAAGKRRSGRKGQRR